MSLHQVRSLVLVGAGQMGMAMASGWLEGGLAPQNLYLVDPTPSDATQQKAAQTGAHLLPTVPNAPADCVVLAIKPQVAAQVMQDVKACVGEKTLVLSVMAGVKSAAMCAALGTDRIVRTMPNTPAKIGKGIIGAFAALGVRADERALVDELLKASGHSVWVDQEGDLDAVTGVSGSGPAYVFHMVEAMAQAGEAEGLNKDVAMALARQTLIGAAGLLEAEPEVSAAQLRTNVTSPNGTTAAALEVLMNPQAGLPALMQRTVHAARKRSEELG